MKEILIGSVLMLALVGCDEKNKDARSQADKPQSQLTRNQAGKILDDLPEIVKWSNDVRNASGDKAVPVCKVDRTPVDCEADGEAPAWIFKFEQSYKNRTILWQRFRVDAVSGDVTIWNPYKGKFVPLSEWRK
ncbi:MAG: hypothetical protein KAV00_03185 [Phycisphaerae bacterium]|nr:hypothetical protein [Phycisphaerae bacterium]